MSNSSPPKRFGNENDKDKINAILKAFKGYEKLGNPQIAARLRKMDYHVDEKNVGMFIYYNMLHKYLERERDVNGRSFYYLKPGVLPD